MSIPVKDNKNTLDLQKFFSPKRSNYSNTYSRQGQVTKRKIEKLREVKLMKQVSGQDGTEI